MNWIHDEARWLREYAKRWERIPFDALRAMLRDAEAAHDYRRATRIRRELARRWAFVRGVMGGDE